MFSAAETPPPTIELTHWWKSPGEQAALQAIRRGIEAHGGKFVDNPIQNYDQLRGSIFERISIGYPPAITQWLAGKEVDQLDELNAITPVPALWRGIPLKDILFPEVLTAISRGGKPAVLPVGIHIQNIAFYNAAIYRKLELPLPSTWTEFLQQAELIRAAGYTAIALSDEPWQLRMLFNAILMEKMGALRFNELYDESKPVASMRPLIVEALTTFMKLKPFTDTGHAGRVWSDTTRQIIDGKAAMQIIGDFAKGELTESGKIAGKDFLCSLTPGANQTIIFAIDSFVMLKLTDPQLLKGQELIFDVVLDPTVQAAFNSKKGGIPVRTDVALEQLDDCTRTYYEQWVNRSQNSIRLPDMDSRLRLTLIQQSLHKAWTENSPPETAAQELIHMIDQVFR